MNFLRLLEQRFGGHVRMAMIGSQLSKVDAIMDVPIVRGKGQQKKITLKNSGLI